jgi:hypothetical protein
MASWAGPPAACLPAHDAPITIRSNCSVCRIVRAIRRSAMVLCSSYMGVPVTCSITLKIVGGRISNTYWCINGSRERERRECDSKIVPYDMKRFEEVTLTKTLKFMLALKDGSHSQQLSGLDTK